MSTIKLPLQWVVLLTVFLLGTVAYYLFNTQFVFTSDAYAQTDITSIAPEVSGQVLEVYVQEGQKVNKGDKLFQLDPAPYEYLKDYAYGSLQSAIQSRASLKESINAAKANVALAKATKNYNKKVWSQKKDLVNLAITQLEGETAQYGLDSAAATLQAEIHTLKSDIATLGLDRDIEYPNVTIAKANLNTAIYNLKQTTIKAPFKGYISGLYLAPGTHLNAGTETFALVNNERLWVMARYKESAIHHIHVGDRATVRFRMFPGQTFHGKVTSIGPGVNRRQASSSVVSSALPYLEQTENWINLDQRFPVRITLDKKEVAAHGIIPTGSSARVFIRRS